MSNPLTEAGANAVLDLREHQEEFDAIVVAGDFHGVALGAVIAALLDKPLMIVCRAVSMPTQSLIVPIGDLDFRRMRYVYVDDAFTFGNSLKRVFDYLDSCGEPAPVVATYETSTRTWKETGREVHP